jgi:hypothetical protein
MTESLHQRFARWRMEELLLKYPSLRLGPASHMYVNLAGALFFCAEGPSNERIEDEYKIEILVPLGFPERIPSVREVAGRIPASFHKLEDGSLCLGSPTRLRLMLLDSPSIICFVERCVIPYLYGYSYFEKHATLPFGQLDHGVPGLLQDLASLYGIDRTDIVPEFVRLTSMKKGNANKQPCPCGSQRRLGQCHHRQVNRLRDTLGRNWFRLVLHDSRTSPASVNQREFLPGALPLRLLTGGTPSPLGTCGLDFS